MYKNIGDYKIYVEVYNKTYNTLEPTERTTSFTHYPTLSNITNIPSVKQNSQNTHKIDNIELIIIIPSLCFTIILIYIAFRFHKLKHNLKNIFDKFDKNKLVEYLQFGTTINEMDL
jgi:hypothetical protein